MSLLSEACRETNLSVHSLYISAYGHRYLLGGVTALNRTTSARSGGSTTRNDGRNCKKRESENKDREGTREHSELFVDCKRNSLESGTEVCSTAESISNIAPFIHFPKAFKYFRFEKFRLYYHSFFGSGSRSNAINIITTPRQHRTNPIFRNYRSNNFKFDRRHLVPHLSIFQKIFLIKPIVW